MGTDTGTCRLRVPPPAKDFMKVLIGYPAISLARQDNPSFFQFHSAPLNQFLVKRSRLINFQGPKSIFVLLIAGIVPSQPYFNTESDLFPEKDLKVPVVKGK